MYLPVIEPIDRLCSEAIECGITGDIPGARRRIDKVRTMRAWLSRAVRSQRKDSIDVWIDNSGIDPSEVPRYRDQVSQLNEKLQLILDWISGSLSAFSHEELVSSQEGLSLYVDSLVPGVWDFSQDVVVLHGEHRHVLFEDLKARGQKRFVIIVGEGEENADQCLSNPPADRPDEDADPLKVIFFHEGSSPSAEAFTGLCGQEVPAVAQISIDSNPAVNQDFKRIMRSISAASLGKRSVKEWPRIFTEQWLSRVPVLTAHESVSSLQAVFQGRDILIASPGPSLYDSLPDLKASRSRFIVVAPIRSLLALLNAGIVPDFAFHVDGTDFSHIIPHHELLNRVSMICTHYAHTSIFEGRFDKIYTVPDPAMAGNVICEAFHGNAVPIIHGGSVATCAVMFAAQFEARSITLIGQDLSLSRGSYVEQAEGANSAASPPAAGDLDDFLSCEGINGERLRTKEDYLWFIGEMENAARLFSAHIQFINSTAHGALLKGWIHKTLDVHPLLSSTANDDSPPTVPEIMSDDEREARRVAVLNALRSEQSEAEDAARLCAELVLELRYLIDSGSNDVTEVEALEALFHPLLSKRSSILHFYTSRFSMALAAAAESVESLEENLSISAEYYHQVGSRAKTLASMLAEAALGIESTSNSGVVGDVG